jgi:hypothetical protein
MPFGKATQLARIYPKGVIGQIKCANFIFDSPVLLNSLIWPYNDIV